ncbi:hypothetical protein HGRIS_011697 [Hohenbuehelia grisea]|uniref:DUF6570 domain-containing protein n=1 Tax=Hohenbuehelia grisea TaxID=104357 RepID=A0ABR3JVW9_9AGAR
MQANAICFEAPVAQLYNKLPPPREDLDDVLAILFRGPAKPTELDFRRTPFLVRRNKVLEALRWLKLNHDDYMDIEISAQNLETYPENYPPVTIEYRQTDTSKIPEGTSLHDMDADMGTEEGECSFVVHGLSGERFDTMSGTLKAKAL